MSAPASRAARNPRSESSSQASSSRDRRRRGRRPTASGCCTPGPRGMPPVRPAAQARLPRTPPRSASPDPRGGSRAPPAVPMRVAPPWQLWSRRAPREHRRGGRRSGRGERLEARLERQRGIDRSEAPGCGEQQRRRVAVAREHEGDLCLQPLHPGALEVIERAELGGRKQCLRGFGSGRLQLRLSGSERPCAAPGRIRRQPSRLVEERGRRGCPTAALGACRRAFQFFCDGLVEARRGVGAMPGLAIRIRGWIGAAASARCTLRRSAGSADQ